MDSLPAALPAAAIASGSTARREMNSPPPAGEVSAASAPEVKVTAADTRQLEPKQPPSKKQRVLKLMQRDEQQPGEDIESASLEELIINIKRAAKAGMLYAAPSASTATVHFWATQVLEAIRSSLGKAKAKAAPHSPKQAQQAVLAAPAVPRVLEEHECVGPAWRGGRRTENSGGSKRAWHGSKRAWRGGKRAWQLRRCIGSAPGCCCARKAGIYG